MDCPQTAPSHLTTTNTANSPTSSATNGQLTSTLTLNGSLWDAAEAVVLSSDDWRQWPRQANGSHNGDYALFFSAGWQCALTRALTEPVDARKRQIFLLRQFYAQSRQVYACFFPQKNLIILLVVFYLQGKQFARKIRYRISTRIDTEASEK